MDVELLKKIKKATITALASDDGLVEALVLKGGNAIDLAYSEDFGSVSRASYDLDYSISDGDFEGDIKEIENRIENCLTQSFLENGFKLFDYKFVIKPREPRVETVDFWGGYKVEFKLIALEDADKFDENVDGIRRNAISMQPNNSTKFELEFSKYEYVGASKKFDVDGYSIRVYTPEMIVFEKVRALCQQLPEYSSIVPSFTSRARARDFYDIELLVDSFNIKVDTDENKKLIANIFDAKRVPLKFIELLKGNKSIHEENWTDVLSTLSASDRASVKEFDYYFEFVTTLFSGLKFP